MFSVQILNKISPAGLELLPRAKYEIASEIMHPDAVLVRSHNMLQVELPPSLKAIARAGTGVNNIPVDRCTDRGIVVFNTPGANANSVKELVLAGLFLTSRNIYQGINWAKALRGRGQEVPKLVEKGKSQFAGPEIKGKKLAVVGLGAIGVAVANDAAALGMDVTGYDPFISVESAWDLSRHIKRAKGFESLLGECDYLTLHVPQTEQTKGMINTEKFQLVKKGARILNFARGGLVNNYDLLEAIQKGIVSWYITDFPDDQLLASDRVIPIPHLGASTPEAGENCARMAVQQVQEFLEKGNIRNSVNFPECEMDFTGKRRLVIANRNIPAMVGQITAVLANDGINIADMLNRSKEKAAYNIIDIDSDISEESISKIRNIKGVTKVRVI
ncbi:MAG: phosphoglycerate dehydrogenase [Spirochaetota bacterium]